MSLTLHTPNKRGSAEGILISSTGVLCLLDERGEGGAWGNLREIGNEFWAVQVDPESSGPQTLSLLLGDELLDSEREGLIFYQEGDGVSVYRNSGDQKNRGAERLALLAPDGWERADGEAIAELIVGPEHFFSGFNNGQARSRMEIGTRMRLSDLALRS